MRAKRISCLCILLLFVLGISSTCQAKSVFAIASHGGSEVKAYSIDPNTMISYQATVEQTESFGAGAGALCLWPSMDRMFITYEQNDGVIAWASIKTLSRDPETDKYNPGVGELAGMLVDENNSLLYALKRQSNKLYAFEYDETDNTLIPEALGAQNDYVELEGITTGGYDIVLDEDGSSLMGIPVGRFYVSDYTSTKVRYYNTATWDYEGYIELDYPAIGIGLDQTRGYLYAGFFTGTSGQDYLMRYTIGGNPNDADTCIKIDMGAPVMDIAVDEDTGFIYMTLKRSTTGGRVGVVEAYDPTNWVETDPNTLVLLDQETDNDFKTTGPAGIAVGPSYKSDGMYIDKSDDVDGFVLPGDVYHYDITYRPDAADETNVVVVDELPDGVDFVSAIPNSGTYYPQPVHEYVWELGDINGGASDSYFELTVEANEWAEPNGVLINIVSAESDVHYTEAEEYTKVSWWGGDVIYVDKNANASGPYIGTSWATAYKSLADGLERAALASDPSVIEIRVADSTYKPGINSGDYFDVPDGIEVYGGYAGYGAADPDERDWRKYETILSGYVGLTGFPPFETVLRNNTVVKMGDGSLLDGVIVEEGNWRGVYGINVDFSISHCIVRNNVQRGISCEKGDLSILWCEVMENGWQGAYHLGSGYSVTVDNSKIHDNQYDGIRISSSIPQVKNSIIYNNGLGSNASYTYYGMNLLNPSSSPDIHNNTIVYNLNEGVRFVGSNAPDVRNNILYYNNADAVKSHQTAGVGTTYYCCVYDPNNAPTSVPDSDGNITSVPDFVYDSEPYGYYHIKYESDCRNAGDNNAVEAGDVDMDNTERKQESVVDIGADEVACEDTYNMDGLDWNFDGAIDNFELAILSTAWLSHDPADPVCNPNHPDYVSDPNLSDYITDDMKARWDPICNFDDTGNSAYVVDFMDFALFANSWPWEACWHEDYSTVMYGMMSGDAESMSVLSEAEGMMAVPMAMERSFSMTSLVQEPVAVYEPDPVSEAQSLTEIIDIVDDAIEGEPDNFEGLLDLKAVLEDWLDEIPVPKERVKEQVLDLQW